MRIFDIFKFNKKVVGNEEPKTLGNEALNAHNYIIPQNVNKPVTTYHLNYGVDDPIPFDYGYTNGFGFPIIIEQSLIESSPAHTQCIRMKINTTIGKGYEFTKLETIKSKSDSKVFEIRNDFQTLLKLITRDLMLHSRIILKVYKNGDNIKFERVGPDKVMYNIDKTRYFYSRDYSLSQIPEIEFKRYEEGVDDGVYMIDYDYNIFTTKFDPYPAPEWISGFQHISINSQIPNFHLANMKNSINPHIIIKRPMEFSDYNQKMRYMRELGNQKGSDNTSNTWLFSANSKEDLPEIEQLEANKNGDLFKELRESSIDDICIAHGINPILIGIKVPGSLGQGSELELAYSVFYNTLVEPMRNHLEYVVDDLIKKSKFNFKFKLNINKINIENNG